MITEGTYPFSYGGVSTWCHTLLENMPDVDYTLLGLASDASQVPQFALPGTVVDFRRQALWGVRNALENRHDLPLAEIWRRRRRTTPQAITKGFLPDFAAFLAGLFGETCDLTCLAEAIQGMYRFFLSYDFDTTLRSWPVWTLFAQEALHFHRRTALESGLGQGDPSLADLTQARQWLYHWLFPLGLPVPACDVAQAAMAGVCTLVAVVAKLEYGAAFMLSEHGNYLRERYLAEAGQTGSLFAKLFKLRFAQRMTQLTYGLADLIAPCCDYNKRWELRNGACPERIETIYYGVDPARFAPDGQARQEPPVVVWVGRIDPLKDPLTFLRAAAVVHRQRPDVQFRLYGSASRDTAAYHQQCLALRHELGLDEAVIFGGYRSDPVGAYREANVYVLSSVSEALPFAVMEAMLCERPVVATAVGGVPEEIEGGGIAVEPGNAEQMGEAILTLVCNHERCLRLGRAARRKAKRTYSIAQMTKQYLAAYRRLTRRGRPAAKAGWAGTVGDLAQAAAEQTLLAGAAVPAAGEGIASLTAEVGRRCSCPVDMLEVTALLESSGVTDDVARQRYGAADVFALAQAVLTHLRAQAPPVGAAGSPFGGRPAALLRAGWRQVLTDLARGPLELVPILVLLLLLLGYSRFGGWGQYRLLALSLGVSASLLVTNGFIQGAGLRAYTYLGLGNRRAAGQFLQKSMACSALAVALIGLLGIGLISCLLPLDPGTLLVFATAFAAFSAIWLAGAALSIAGQPFWMPAALLGGLLIAFVADRALVPLWELHLAAGSLLGFATTLGLTLGLGARHYRGSEAAGRKQPLHLPSLGYLLLDAAPAFAYGALYMVFIFAPHVLGWLGALRLGAPLPAIAILEVGLVLSMLPLILLDGATALWLKQFWRHLSAELPATPGRNAARLDYRLGQLYRAQRRRYALALAALSLLDYGAFRLAFDTGYLTALLGLPRTGPLLFVFVASLLAYWLLGLGVFNAMYCTTLGRAHLPAWAITLAIAVTVGSGLPLCLLGHYTYSVLAFVAGSATFFALSQRLAGGLMERVHYSYLSSQ